MNTELSIKTIFKDKIVNDEIVLEVWTDDNKAVNTIAVSIKNFIVLFPDKLEDVDNVKGYKKYFDDWKKEGVI